MLPVTRALLTQVASGQEQRNVSDTSIALYLSKMHVLTKKLNSIEDLRFDALEFDADGNPLRHSNAASNVFKLKLPMEVITAKLLFAALSIDGSLARKRTRRVAQEPLPEVQGADNRNMGANISTVSTQTYQNYKSALKWWHEYSCSDFDKVGYDFPSSVDKAINIQIGSYKRDVGSKKRRGIMSQKEGKSKYNTSTLWNLWHFGDSNRRIGPYKCICRKSDLTEALCKVNYSRTKSIMKALTDLAIGEQMIRSASEINQQNNQAIFDQVMAMLMLDLYPEPHERPVDININTLCNKCIATIEITTVLRI